MNALTNQALFASAYRQLTPAERAFVDDAVRILENAAHREAERISAALYKPIPVEIVEKSRGMLDKPLVRAAISERITELAAAQELTVQRMVKEMMAIAFSSMGDYVTIEEDDEGNALPYFDLTKCTPEQLSAIKSIDMEEVGDGLSRPVKRKIKITLHDKLGGMTMLGRYMGLLEPDNPFWKADAARAAPVVDRPDAAGDAYAQMIDQ